MESCPSTAYSVVLAALEPGTEPGCTGGWGSYVGGGHLTGVTGLHRVGGAHFGSITNLCQASPQEAQTTLILTSGKLQYMS